MAAEPAVATGELRGLAAGPLGQRVRGLADHLLRRRLIAHAHHDAGRAPLQRRQIRLVVADDRDQPPGEQLQVGAHPGPRRRILRRLLAPRAARRFRSGHPS
jgi:hypothetical protein